MNRFRALIRSEADAFEFRGRSTIIVAVLVFAVLAPYYDPVTWLVTPFEKLGGSSVDALARRYGITHSLLWDFGIPVLAIVLLRERPRDYGLGLGDVKTGLRFTGLGYLLYLPCFAFLMSSMAFREYYAAEANAYLDWSTMLKARTVVTVVSVTQTEFLFRGFALFGLKKDYGPYVATLVSLALYVPAHVGKPAIEAFGSFPIGLALCYLAVKTNSIWYGVVLHATIGLGFYAAVLLS